MSDRYTQGLQIYLVGGAVRDAYLGLPLGDRDWVVVGSSPQRMVDRGFIPVGGDFPVFLHPLSHEEYALARTERKTAKGYKGFTFYTGQDVTLEQDLQRRDLTINAMAQDGQGRLIDPYSGLHDLNQKRLRHVSPAFSEDPVRILRIARFLARFTAFTVAPETYALCETMVKSGEVDALVPERVYKELSRALMADQPSRAFAFLHQIHALEKVIPALVWNEKVGAWLDQASQEGMPLECRYALLCTQSQDVEAVALAMKAPSACNEYAQCLQRWCKVLKSEPLNASQQLDLLLHMDVLRKPERFNNILSLYKIILNINNAGTVERWQKRASAIQSVDAGAVARAFSKTPQKIAQAVYQARLTALTQVQ